VLASIATPERHLSDSKDPEAHPSTSTRDVPAGRALAHGHFETGLANRGSLRWVVVDITEILETARVRLDLSPIAAIAFGRAMTGAILLHRIALKVPARLQVEVLGDGALGKVFAEVNSEGHLRGTVGNPHVPNPPSGELQIAEAVGSGLLRVTRDRGAAPYSSQVELVTGELGADITHYLQQSEQIRSAVLLGVLPQRDGIAAAGGMIVEALPGTEDDVISKLERRIASLQISETIAAGGTSQLLDTVLAGLDTEQIERQPLSYQCRCSREALLLQLLPLAQQDLESVIGDDGLCDAECAFCGERYTYSANELLQRH